MDRPTKELMDRALEADRLPPAALQHMSQSLLFRLERGDAPLSGIDASAVVPCKPALLTKLLAASGGAWKLALVVGLSIASGATLWVLTGSYARPDQAGVSAATQVPATQGPFESSEPRSLAEDDDRLRGQPLAPVDAQPQKAGRFAARSTPEPVSLQPASVSPPRRVVRTAPSGIARPQLQTEPTRAVHTDSTSRSEGSPTPATAAAPEKAEPQIAEHEREQPPARPVVAVDAEFALLQRAYSELSAGHPARAFPILDEHVRRFPHGALLESREVARMLALCAIGQITDARLKADEFLNRYPTSTFRVRVQRICPLETK